MPIAVVTEMVRPALASCVPDGLQVHWFSSAEQALALAPEADIGWFDMRSKPDMARAVTAATRMRWLNSIYAGIDGLPLDVLQQRGVVLTNGVGINALTIAEYVVMGMLSIAKGYREVVRAQDRHEWLMDAPGKVELAGSRALILGYGGIGQLLAPRLKAFEVDVTVVRRTPGPDSLRPDQWRERLAEFDWIVLAVPATPETEHLIGAAELAAMKPTATLLNVARGSVVDQDALVHALRERRIGHAFLDVTTPEPLPADHPLWALDNAHISMHLSGRSQSLMVQRSVARFLENFARFQRGEPLSPQVNLDLGY